METKKKNIDKVHKEALGFGMPNDYFETSKSEILAKVKEKKEIKIVSLHKRKLFWLAVAGIALVFTLTVYKQQTINSIKNIPTIVLDTLNFDKNLNLAADFISEEDVFIASLFVSDDYIEAYVNNAFIEDIKADEYLDNFIVDELMPDDLF